MKNQTQNFVTKLEQIRNLIQMRFPKIDARNLLERMSLIGHYHYNKKKFLLLGENRDLYNFLIENSYNPYTVYRWLLLERIPQEIKWQLKNNQISQKRAVHLSMQRRKETENSLAAEIKAIGMQLVGGM